MSKGNGEAYECLVTVGMRGDGDEPMAETTATKLLESIVAAQRDIIRDVTARPAELQPQVWALYKEVQDYYDHGMKVPDDVTLLFADDNWGQVRRLPTGDLDRKGGYGVYYHFDYVGGPRNYKWLNTNQIEKVWQQMDLAYRRGAQALWLVNVGDIKPMEFPLSFFMAQAWDPEAMTLDTLANYPQAWAQSVFGPAHAKEIGGLLTRYARLAALRKPELVDPGSFALGAGTGGQLDGGEFGEWMTQWSSLVRDLLKARAQISEAQYDAFYQLVEHPIVALSNLYQLYYMVAWNRRLAAAGDARANTFADRAEAAFKRDDEIMHQYHALKGGKWDGMMLQTHIGYTTWQQPETQLMPEVKRVSSSGKPAEVVFAKSGSEASRNPGAIIIDAGSFSAAHGGKGLEWRVIPNLGRSGAGAVTAFPQGRPATSQGDGVCLEYSIDARAGDASASLHLLPTLDTSGGVDVRIGVSLDDGPLQTLSMRLVPSPGPPTQQEQRNWEQAVIDNEFVLEAKFSGVTAGKHALKVWRIDDNALLTKIVVN